MVNETELEQIEVVDQVEISENEANLDVGVDETNNIFELPAGQALSIEDTYSITASESTKFVVLAGPSGCGKTTLLITLYQLFQKGAIGNFYFAGSQTLQGFEQRAFHTRISSNLSSPETVKTRRGISDSILHLKFWDSKIKVMHNFLLSDFSGEDYSSAIANVELMQEDFGILRRADVIVIIIDGDRITEREFRNSTLQRTIELLKTMDNANLLSKSVVVEIVISKYDLVKKKCGNDSIISEYINSIPSKILGRTENLSDESIKFFEVAAMPKDDVCEIGFGLLQLLNSWTEIKEILYTPEQLQQTSEFNKFQKRMLGASV